MKIIDYIPWTLKYSQHADKLRGFLDTQNILGSIIDRTSSISCPFEADVIFQIPNPSPIKHSFEDLCLERAQEFLDTDKKLMLFYSGGIDSSAIMLAFHHLAKPADRERILVVTTPESQIENPTLWKTIVQNYQVQNTLSAIDQLQSSSVDAYVIQGENADQLFGSVKLFQNDLTETEFSLNTLTELVSRFVDAETSSRLIPEIEVLIQKSPLPITSFASFYWWYNFACRWQHAALQTVRFIEKEVKVNDLKFYETFFNTEDFQLLSMSESFEKWNGDKYKGAARKFIAKYLSDDFYVENKTKVGSAWHLVRGITPKYVALGVEGDTIYPLTQTEFDKLI
jgi:hypothetical protein